MKKHQSYRSHSKYVPGFHFVILPAVLALLIGSVVNLFIAGKESFFTACLMVLVALILAGFSWYFRRFALIAQDRAIRAEENLRHFVLTGKPLPQSIRMRQIIALRFAPDEELPGLAAKADAEKLSSKEIKLAIKNWRPDYHRA